MVSELVGPRKRPLSPSQSRVSSEARLPNAVSAESVGFLGHARVSPCAWAGHAMMVDGIMSKDPAWERHRSSLAVQAGFVRNYSPLTAALLDQAVEWLDDPEGRGRELGDPQAVVRICERLVGLLAEGDEDGISTGWIDDLQPALRLNACLHWYVLEDDPRIADLR